MVSPDELFINRLKTTKSIGSSISLLSNDLCVIFEFLKTINRKIFREGVEKKKQIYSNDYRGNPQFHIFP